MYEHLHLSVDVMVYSHVCLKLEHIRTYVRMNKWVCTYAAPKGMQRRSGLLYGDRIALGRGNVQRGGRVVADATRQVDGLTSRSLARLLTAPKCRHERTHESSRISNTSGIIHNNYACMHIQINNCDPSHS